MLTDKSGVVVYDRITVKIFGINNCGHRVDVITAPAGKAWNEDGIRHILYDVAASIMKELPDEEYEMVEVGQVRFNFVWRRHKQLVM